MCDDTASVINHYLSKDGGSVRRRLWGEDDAEANEEIALHLVSVCDENNSFTSATRRCTPLKVHIRYTLKKPIHKLRVVILLMTSDGTEVICSSDLMSDVENAPRKPVDYSSTCSIPALLLNRLNYTISIDFEVPGERLILTGYTIDFEVSQLAINQLGTTKAPSPPGMIHPILDWKVKAA